MSETQRPAGYAPIESYGVIGDLRTIALVGGDASIDFLCIPEFDSPTVFAALLDHRRGGRFKIAPVLNHARSKQLYLPDTNILVTRFLSAEGVAEITDFMPVAETGPSGRLIRIVRTIRGELDYRLWCEPRFDYARGTHHVELGEREVYFRGPPQHSIDFELTGAVDFQVRDGAVEAMFRLRAGESLTFVAERASPDRPPMTQEEVDRALADTAKFWRAWSARSTYRGRWREMVSRSALVLKLLTSHRYGSITAAGTFGLPELIGGERNWDYRYTWIRDASFTLFALMRLGYTDEATSFMDWLHARLEACPGDGSLGIMYAIDGRADLAESELAHLDGYRGSKPVRIGNGAFDQLQLDIYGEMMDAVYLSNKYGRAVSYDSWSALVKMIEFVRRSWRQPDEGVWEVRGGRREFLHSRVMCWVAVDRAIRMATKMSLPAPLADWEQARNEIHYSVYQDFWDDEQKTFVQYKGSKRLDASALLMPLVRFISPTDPRFLSTLRAIGDRLVDDALVFRYDTEQSFDGLRGGEGSFTPCSFWYIECLARAGSVGKARLLFEKMLGYANHLGLYAEELGPSGEHLGNFPQAWTHLSLISAASTLDRATTGRRSPWQGWG